MKTIIVGLVASLIIFLVFKKIYKDYKKNKNFSHTKKLHKVLILICMQIN